MISSLQAIPRTVLLDSKLGDNLIQVPVEEVKSLRGNKVSKTKVKLEAASIVKIEGSSGGQVKMVVQLLSSSSILSRFALQ